MEDAKETKMNPPKTDSEYALEAVRMAQKCATQSAVLRFPYKNQRNAAKVYVEETTKVILNGIPDLASLLRARDELPQVQRNVDDAVHELYKLRVENDALKAELASLKTVAKAAQQWIEEHKPQAEESFYQMDSITEALPELGIALFTALEAHSAKGYKLEC